MTVLTFTEDEARFPGASAVDYNLSASKSADALLGKVKLLFYRAGLPVDIVIRQGDVARAILDYARHDNCDLIVVGTRGRGGFKGMLLGSVSQKIIQKSHCPVIIVK